MIYRKNEGAYKKSDSKEGIKNHDVQKQIHQSKVLQNVFCDNYVPQ